MLYDTALKIGAWDSMLYKIDKMVGTSIQNLTTLISLILNMNAYIHSAIMFKTSNWFGTVPSTFAKKYEHIVIAEKINDHTIGAFLPLFSYRKKVIVLINPTESPSIATYNPENKYDKIRNTIPKDWNNKYPILFLTK